MYDKCNRNILMDQDQISKNKKVLLFTFSISNLSLEEKTEKGGKLGGVVMNY